MNSDSAPLVKDLVLCLSHPLALRVTPQQVWINGIERFAAPHLRLLPKPAAFQKVPNTHNFDKEVEESLKCEGLPHLQPSRAKSSAVVFMNVTTIFLHEEYSLSVLMAFAADASDGLTTRVVVV